MATKATTTLVLSTVYDQRERPAAAAAGAGLCDHVAPVLYASFHCIARTPNIVVCDVIPQPLYGNHRFLSSIFPHTIIKTKLPLHYNQVHQSQED